MRMLKVVALSFFVAVPVVAQGAGRRAQGVPGGINYGAHRGAYTGYSVLGPVGGVVGGVVGGAAATIGAELKEAPSGFLSWLSYRGP
jgi:hypothetical protein